MLPETGFGLLIMEMLAAITLMDYARMRKAMFIYADAPTVLSGIASGGFQNTDAGGYDAFLVKFDSNGNRLWATYYGGTGDEISSCLATDAAGNVYMAGITPSTSGIAYGGFQNTLSGSADEFLVKFNSAGNRIWATYYGGPGAETGTALATDASGNIFLAGSTPSTSGIASGGFQNTYGGGTYDAFLAKISTSCSLLWATYYGGSNTDGADGLATNAAGDVIMSGQTSSGNNIASGGFQSNLAGSSDHFIASFDPNGNRLCATYFGGTGAEIGGFDAVDASGNVYLASYTNSTSGLASGGFQNTYGGGTYDVLFAKFSSCTSTLSANTVANNFTCPGYCTASATVTAQNGFQPYTYNWSTSPAQTTATATGLCATTYTVTVTDASSFTVTNNVTITAHDAIFPTITCPSNVTVSNTTGSCGANVTYPAATANDNCNVASLVYSQNSGTFFPVGTTIVTATATDGSGNTASCTFNVTVQDLQSPTIICPSNITTVMDPGKCYATVSLGTPTIGDNCAVASTTNNAPPNYPDGTTTVTWTVTNINGLSNTCQQTVSVTDDELPSITCPANIFQVNDAGVCGAIVNYPAVTASDNCTGFTLTQTSGLPSGSFFPVGMTPNTYVVTDAANNTASCSFNVLITDNEPPVINCPNPITLCYEQRGNAIGMATAVDNCSATPSITIVNNKPTILAPGLNIITWTATDEKNNSSTCNQVVTVSGQMQVFITESMLPPYCQGEWVTLTANVSGTPAVSYLWSTGETTPSINVSTSGTYLVAVTNALGCTANASYSLVVNLSDMLFLM